MHHTFFRKDLKTGGPLNSIVGPTRWRSRPHLDFQPHLQLRAPVCGGILRSQRSQLSQPMLTSLLPACFGVKWQALGSYPCTGGHRLLPQRCAFAGIPLFLPMASGVDSGECQTAREKSKKLHWINVSGKAKHQEEPRKVEKYSKNKKSKIAKSKNRNTANGEKSRRRNIETAWVFAWPENPVKGIKHGCCSSEARKGVTFRKICPNPYVLIHEMVKMSLKVAI